MKIHLDESRDKRIKLISELNNRECIVRINANGVLLPAFKGVTLDYNSVPRVKNEVEDINMVDKDDTNKSTISFNIGNNVALKDILLSNSTGRKGVKE